MRFVGMDEGFPRWRLLGRGSRLRFLANLQCVLDRRQSRLRRILHLIRSVRHDVASLLRWTRLRPSILGRATSALALRSLWIPLRNGAPIVPQSYPTAARGLYRLGMPKETSW